MENPAPRTRFPTVPLSVSHCLYSGVSYSHLAISMHQAGGPHPYQSQVRPALSCEVGASMEIAAQLGDLDASLIDPKSYPAPGAYWTRRHSHDRVVLKGCGHDADAMRPVGTLPAGRRQPKEARRCTTISFPRAPEPFLLIGW